MIRPLLSPAALLCAGLVFSPACSCPGPTHIVCGKGENYGQDTEIYEGCAPGKCPYVQTPEPLCEYHFGDKFPDAKAHGECTEEELNTLTVLDGCPIGASSETAGDGGDDGNNLWICSLQASTNCTRTEDGVCPPPEDNTYDHNYCWAYGTVLPCVTAPDATSAQQACMSDCAGQKSTYDSSPFPGETVCQSMQCTAAAVQPVLKSAFPGIQCEGYGGALPAWDGSGAFQTFTATAGLVLDDGSTATLDDLHGYLNLSVTNCTPTTCDVALDALEATRKDGTVQVFDPNGAPTTYTVEGLDFRLIQRVTGHADLATGGLTFDDPFYGTAWARQVGGGVVATDPSAIGFASAATGSLSPTGELQLSLTFNIDGNTVVLDIN